MLQTTTLCTALPPAEQARHETAQSVARHATCGPDQIDRRLEELDRELGTERAVEAGAVVVLTGAILGPAPTASRLPGWRSAADMSEERYALKVLRGDFRDVPALTTAEERAEVARFEGEGGRASDPDEQDALDRHDQAAIAEALQAARR